MIILKEYGIAYTPIPKVACTSMKHLFHEIEFEREFTPEVTRKGRYQIHHVYPTGLYKNLHKKVIKRFFSLAIVRDPLERFLSAYSNRVIHHRELSVEKSGRALADLGLNENPDLPEFIAKYEYYLRVHPSILHHTRPMIDFSGKNPNTFSRIYRLDRLNEAVNDISEVVGRDLVLRRLQTGGPKFLPSDLTCSEQRKIKHLYRKDYRVFRRFF